MPDDPIDWGAVIEARKKEPKRGVEIAPASQDAAILAAEERILRTPEERTTLLMSELAPALAKEAVREGGDPIAVYDQIRESRGAVMPSPQPGLLESVARAYIPRVAGPDPRVGLIKEAQRAMSGRVPLPVEALGRLVAPETTGAVLGTPVDSWEARRGHEAARQRELAGAADVLVRVARSDPRTQLAEKALKGVGVETDFPSFTERQPIVADDSGVPLESPEMALLRFVGGVMPAVIQEGVAEIPVPAPVDHQGRAANMTQLAGEFIRRTARDDESVSQVLGDMLDQTGFGMVRLEDAVLGTTPEQRGLLADASLEGRWGMTKAFMRAMHKVEQGRHLGDDFLAAATLKSDVHGLPEDAPGLSPPPPTGPETTQEATERLSQWRKDVVGHGARSGFQGAAWLFGFGVDILAPWELAAKPVALGARAVSTTAKLPEGVNKAKALASILRGRKFDVANDTADLVASKLEAGETVRDIMDAMPHDLKAAVRVRLDDAGFTLLDDVDLGAQLKVDLDDVALPPPDRPTLVPRAPRPAPRPDDAQLPINKVTAATEAANRAKVGLDDATRAADEADAVVAATKAESVEEAKAALGQIEVDAKGNLLFAESEIEAALVEAARADGIVRVSSMAAWRAARDALMRAFATDVPIANRNILEGFRTNKHEASALLRWLDPEQTLSTPAYRLLGQDGKVIYEGDFSGASSRMLNRQRVGDRIMFRDQRDVANWRKRTSQKDPTKERGQIIADHNFSTPEEGAFIHKLLSHPRGAIPEDEVVRQLVAGGKLGISRMGPDMPSGVGLAVRQFVRTFLGADAPPPVRRLTEQQSLFVEVVEDSLKAHLRGTVGTSDLVEPLPGVSVTKQEWSSIIRRVKKDYKETGFNPKDLGSVNKSRYIGVTPNQRKAMAKFFARHGLYLRDSDFVGDTVSMDALSKASVGVLRRLAGKSADGIGATRSTADLSGYIMAAVSDAVQGEAGAIMRRQQSEAAKGSGLLYWIDDAARRRQLDPAARRIIEAAMLRLETVGAALVHDMRSIASKGGSPSEMLSQVIETYRPVSLNEMHVIDLLGAASKRFPNTTAGRTAKHNHIFALRDQIASHVKGDADIPQLWANDPRDILAGMLEYRAKRRAEMADLGRKVLKAAAPDGVDAARLDGPAGPTMERLVNVWRHFQRDKFDSPFIAETLAETFIREGQPSGAVRSQRDSFLRLAVVLKQGDVSRDVARLLLENKIGVADPRTVAAVEYMMKPKAVSRGDEIRHPFTQSEMSRAKVFLRRMGIGVSPDDMATQVDLAKYHGATLPYGLVEELRAAERMGLSFRNDSDTMQALTWLYGNYKDGLTTYNPAYHITNIAGIPFIAMQQMGMRKALQTSAFIFSNTKMVSELNKRLVRGPIFKPATNDGKVFVTEAGMVYSLDELERAAMQLGVGTTFQMATTGRQLAEDFDRVEGLWTVLGREVTGTPAQVRHHAATFRDGIAGVSESFERQWRLGVWLDNIHQGRSLESAAELARDSLFDYAQLTRGDRHVMRKAVLFWTFHRKSMEGMLKNLADNPHRLAILMRFAARQREGIHADDVESRRLEQVQLDDRDLSRLVLGPRLRGDDLSWVEMSTGSAISPIDSVWSFRNLVMVPLAMAGAASPGSGQEAAQELLNQGANPAVALAVNLATDVDVASSFRTDTAGSNVIPEYMLTIPFLQPLTEKLFAPTDGAMPAGQAIDRAQTNVNGRLSRHVATNTRRWQAFRSLAGRWAGDTVPDFIGGWQAVDAALELSQDPFRWQTPAPWGSNVIDILQMLGTRAEVRTTGAVPMQEARTENVSDVAAEISAAQRESRL